MISTICTRAAIIRMKLMVCIKPRPNTSSTYFCTRKVTSVAMVSTNATAAPMPIAVSTFLDTPRNGHIPKNWDNTTLLTNTAAININIYSISYLVLCFTQFINNSYQESQCDECTRSQYKNQRAELFRHDCQVEQFTRPQQFADSS